MDQRENEIRKKKLTFNAKEIVLAVKMIEELEKTIEVVYHLMEHEGVESFVLLLLTAEKIELFKLLDGEKRDTDILFKIDKEENIYVMLCQDTKVDGGYHFAQRVIRNILAQKGENIYCAEVEVRSTRNQVKNVIFKLLETFMKTKVDGNVNEIIYKSLQ